MRALARARPFGRAIMACCLSAPGLLGFVLVNPAEKPVREGNRAYEAGDYERALKLYRSAAEVGEGEPVAHFNAGSALYRQGRYKEAVEEYQRALGRSADLDAAAHYNIGNCQFKMGRLDEAIASYRRTLELAPDDLDAKYNLELAMRLVERAQARQRGQGSGEQMKRREQRPGKEAETGQRPPGTRKPDSEQKTGKQAPQRARAIPMSREEALRLLEALAAQDRQVQRRIMRVPRRQLKGPRPEKDW